MIAAFEEEVQLARELVWYVWPSCMYDALVDLTRKGQLRIRGDGTK
jgi:hypothetical protein